jgi:hypothetical protein
VDPRGSRVADFPGVYFLSNLEFFPCLFRIRTFLDFVSFHTLSAGDRSWMVELERGTIAFPD